jgi:peptidoglycan/LPS O-acetylase OafA/YrhL
VIPAATADQSRIAELDVLRGLAALVVMLFHHTVIFQNMYGDGRPPGLQFGVFAVHLFFMISGFVIFMTLARTRSALDFMVSRGSRLFPVFWVAVLLTQTVMSLAPLPVLAVSWHDALWNLTMLAEPLHVPMVDNVYWSLVIELAFYALMLVLFLAGGLRHIERLVMPWLLVQLAAVAAGTWLDYRIPAALTVLLLLKYAHLFLAGMLCYRIRSDGVTPVRHALLAACCATQFAVQGVAAGIFGLLWFALFYALARRWLAWIALRPLVFLGTISYSLYLVHQNIGYVVMRALAAWPRPAQLLAAAATVLLLATLLTFLVEQPALRLIRRLYKKLRAPQSALAIAGTS